MSDEHGPDLEQLEAHARGVMLESATELSQQRRKLVDLAALLPDPSTVVVRRGGVVKTELASDELQPPTVLEAQLGIVEQAIEQLDSVIGALTDGAEISIDALVESWLSRRGADRRAGIAALARGISIRRQGCRA